MDVFYLDHHLFLDYLPVFLITIVDFKARGFQDFLQLPRVSLRILVAVNLETSLISKQLSHHFFSQKMNPLGEVFAIPRSQMTSF